LKPVEWGFGAIAQLGERLLCKQEVTGSIPVGSTGGSTCKSVDFGRLVVLDWYSVLAESTAGEYHVGPDFAGNGDRADLQAGGCRAGVDRLDCAGALEQQEVDCIGS
jgi:hypothetical protein